MSRLLRWIAGLCTVLAAASAQADELPRMSLVFNYSSGCPQIQAEAFLYTRHAKGDRGGVLNENTTYGSGVTCSYRYGEYLWVTLEVNTLFNSRWAKTFAAGPGVELHTPKWRGLSFSIGGRLPYVYYPVPEQGQIYAWLPVETRGIHLQVSEEGHGVSFMQREFGTSKDRIHLYSMVVTIPLGKK